MHLLVANEERQPSLHLFAFDLACIQQATEIFVEFIFMKIQDLAEVKVCGWPAFDGLQYLSYGNVFLALDAKICASHHLAVNTI